MERVVPMKKPMTIGPAGQLEQPVALQVRQEKKTGTQGDGDAVVRIAAEDAHQQHQEIAVLEILVGNARVLGNEERHDANGAQFEDGRLVPVEEIVRTGAEQDDEGGRTKDARNVSGGMGDTPRKIDQQGEEQCRGRIDEFRLPDVASPFRKQGQGGKHDEKDGCICGFMFHV